jgi:aminoglycoside phosphotransferase (APT) family kinase protein
MSSSDFHELNVPELNVPALSDYLEQHLPGYRGPLSLTRFADGQSNPTFKLISRHSSYAMRTKPGPAAKLLPSAHAIEREYRVMRALAGTDVPVPKVYCLCEDETVIGRAFYVMELIDGRVLWDQSLPGIARAERQAIYAEMNRVIAALHSVDFSAIGLSDFGKPGNYLARQVSRWSKQYRVSETERIDAMNRLIEWLPAHLPPEGAPSIVHGDYRLDNLVFAHDAPRILAVLDWELATLGDPLADFSYHCLSWHLPPGLIRGIAGLDLGALGLPREEEYVAMYCKRTARALPAHWDCYVAYNLFRAAAISQGIVKRAAEGTAANTRALANKDLVAPLASAGWEIARRLDG